MMLNPSPTELTTSATDAILALECILMLVYLRRSPRENSLKIGLWTWVFGLLAFASLLGTLAHGLVMTVSLKEALWKPLYLSLGLVVSLFLTGVFLDWKGRDTAKRILPWSIGMGVLFFGLTEVFNGAFLVFVIYEAVVMLTALGVYSFLGATRRLKGAGIVALAVFLNILAAGIQASSVSLTLVVPFDHNGVFHLVQMAGVAALAMGLRRGLMPTEI
ncbi:MAG: hypothetical protein KKF30_09970 [Proteobacteria bacterium]|nr:hypothetical protein [Pseudomonadota bacterium]MBU4468867.1 hypothetical protein [Pseudomonadota bacterium]MCG2750860.1 hypothetical protein [Desulfobacteraceae bacterium]